MACESLQQQLDSLKKSQQEAANEATNPATAPAAKTAAALKVKELAASISSTQASLNACLKQAGAAKPVAAPLIAKGPIGPIITKPPGQPVKPPLPPPIPPGPPKKPIGPIMPPPPTPPKKPIGPIGWHPVGGLHFSPEPARILNIQDVVSQDWKNQAIDAREKLIGSMASANPAKNLTFPSDVAFEWIQPLAPTTAYDEQVVAATGWAVNPNVAAVDFPFGHPFGNDWEFALALDGTQANASGPYDYLLSAGNKGPYPPIPTDERTQDEAVAQNLGLSFPRGLLGVEIDGGNVPPAFATFVNTHPGCRAALYGRWIVDCGHPFHRCEIHPPLLMAAAAHTDDSTTRVLFTSRPYLADETYTTDLSTIYNDNAPNDGTFYDHLKNEIYKVAHAGSTMIEAHPKIKSHPFVGVLLAHFVIRPPSDPATLEPQQLNVSFNFTVRSGCSVQVLSSATGIIDVMVVMNQAGYKPPPLPANHQRTLSIAELIAQDPSVQDQISTAQEGAEAETGGIWGDAGSIFGPGGLLLAAGIGAEFAHLISSRGVKTDAYASLAGRADINFTKGAVNNAAASSIPANAGITHNDSQPFPVFGWLETKWAPSKLVMKPIAEQMK